MTTFDYPNLQTAWEQISREHPERPILKAPGSNPDQQLSFRAATLYRRAQRLAIALQSELGLEPGDKVGLLVEEPDELAICLHGCFVGCSVAVLLPLELPTEQIVSLLNNCNVKCVIFSPSAAARVASMFERTFSVKSWVVTSRGVSFSTGGAVRKLDELLAASAGVELSAESMTEEDCPALIVLTPGSGPGPHGISFSQLQLIHAARSTLPFQSTTAGGMGRAFVPLKTLLGTVYSFIAPLFTDGFTYAGTELDLKNFWDQVAAEGLTHLVLNQEQLRVITRRGKSRSWTKPPTLTIGLVSSSPLSSELLATFERRFGIDLYPCYSLSEAGALVTAFPRGEPAEYVQSWLYDYYLPSSGIPLPGVEFFICDLEGREVKEEVLGEILVRAPQVMTVYSGTPAGEVYFGQKSLLHTGDEGFYVKDPKGRKHLFCTGRIAELVIRNNVRVNPARIDNILYNIEGVEFACTVGFPNMHTGHEIGAYVVPLRSASLTEQMVRDKLREELEWPQCPKVLVFGKRPTEGAPPKRQQLAALFQRYYDTDFSRG